MKRITPLLILIALAFAPNTAQAQVLASDDFSYPDGTSLSLQAGWGSHSGTPEDFMVTDGQAVVQHGVPSEDVNLTFADVTEGNLTATFDITVNGDEPINGGGGFDPDFEYFAHFFTDGSFNFRARLSVVEPNGTGDYTLGLSSTTSTEEVLLTTDFSFGDVVPIELVLDVTTGVASLTVNGETIVGTSGEVGETINRFALRQSDSPVNETVTVDNLVINGPSTTFLLGDVNLDEVVNFLDISPFIAVLSAGGFQLEADIDQNGVVNFLDISPFIAILSGS